MEIAIQGLGCRASQSYGIPPGGSVIRATIAVYWDLRILASPLLTCYHMYVWPLWRWISGGQVEASILGEGLNNLATSYLNAKARVTLRA